MKKQSCGSKTNRKQFENPEFTLKIVQIVEIALAECDMPTTNETS
jgi:hypothetical protein